MKNKLSIAILICTLNRKKLLLRCLKSIKNQTQLPTRLVIIEKEIKKSTINKNKLKNIFGNKISIFYKSIKKGNISVSRNLALKSAQEDVVLFVDDDVVLDKNYINNLLNIYQKNPHIFSIVGQIRPTQKGYWQNFTHKILTASIKDENKKQRVNVWPGMNFSFRRNINLFYNEKYSALEDIEFCLQLKERGLIINYFPQLQIKHDYISTQKEFIKKFTGYFQKNLSSLKADHPKSFFYTYYFFEKPSLKKYLCLLNSFFKESNFLLNQLRLPKRFMFACMIYFSVIYKIMYFDNQNFGKVTKSINKNDNWHF